MELAKEDILMLMDSQNASGHQQAAVHAPLPKHWCEGLTVGEGSGGQVVPEIIAASTGSFVTIDWKQHDPLEALLGRVESAFGITRGQLAQACKTTRKTVYNWIDGTSEPQAKNRERLFTLDVLATDWADAGYTTDRSLLQQPVIDGRSVFELLCDDSIDSELVLFAGSRIAMHRDPVVLADPFST